MEYLISKLLGIILYYQTAHSSITDLATGEISKAFIGFYSLEKWIYINVLGKSWEQSNETIYFSRFAIVSYHILKKLSRYW